MAEKPTTHKISVAIAAPCVLLLSLILQSCQPEDLGDTMADKVCLELDSVHRSRMDYNSSLVNSGELDSAILHGKEYLQDLRREGNRVGIAEIYNNLGLAHFYKLEYDSAMAYLGRSLDISNDIDFEKGRVNATANLSLIHKTVGDTRRALVLCQQVMDYYDDTDKPYQEMIMSMNLALMYLDLDEWDSCRQALDRALQVMPRLDQPEPHIRAHALSLKVKTLIREGNVVAAEQAHQEAMTAYEDLDVEYSQTYLSALGVEADILMAKQAPYKTIDSLKAEIESRYSPSLPAQNARETLETLSRISHFLGRWDLAYSYKDSAESIPEVTSDLTLVHHITDNLRELEKTKMAQAGYVTNEESEAESTAKLWPFIGPVLILFALIGFIMVYRRHSARTSMVIQPSNGPDSESELLESLAKVAVESAQNRTEKGDSDRLANQLLTAELRSTKLVTRDGIEEFKKRFEHVEPGMLYKLRSEHAGITPSEERLFCLTRLNFSIQEIANILGVAPETVVRNRQRLTKRLNLSSSSDLEKYIQRY